MSTVNYTESITSFLRFSYQRLFKNIAIVCSPWDLRYSIVSTRFKTHLFYSQGKTWPATHFASNLVNRVEGVLNWKLKAGPLQLCPFCPFSVFLEFGKLLPIGSCSSVGECTGQHMLEQPAIGAACLFSQLAACLNVAALPTLNLAGNLPPVINRRFAKGSCARLMCSSNKWLAWEQNVRLHISIHLDNWDNDKWWSTDDYSRKGEQLEQWYEVICLIARRRQSSRVPSHVIVGPGGCQLYYGF